MPKKREDNILFTHEWWFLSEYTLRASDYKVFERQDQSSCCSAIIKSSQTNNDVLTVIKLLPWKDRYETTHTHRLDFALVYVGVESRGPGLFTLKKVSPHSLWAGYTEQESCSASSCWYVTFLLHFISYKSMCWLCEQILCADLVIYHMAT